MAYNTIKIKKYSDHIEEFTAAAAIYPGMVLEMDSAGKAKVHATAGGNVVPVMVALEDELQGKGIDDAYAADDKVQVWLPAPGDVFYGVLADGQTIAKGDQLESDANGRLQKHAADPGDSTVGSVQNAIIGIALDTISTAAGSEDSDINFLSIYRRIPVRVR
jgi:hypothetical protein